MGILKLENLPKEAVPLTRSANIKLVLDTPKGMFCVFFVLSLLCSCHLLCCLYMRAKKWQGVQEGVVFVIQEVYENCISRRCIRVDAAYFVYGGFCGLTGFCRSFESGFVCVSFKVIEFLDMFKS